MTLPMLTAAPAHLGGGGGGVDVSLIRIVAALLVCVVAAVALALVLRRAGGRFDLAALRSLTMTRLPTRRIAVIESRRISAHADLCLVRCDDDEYLILSSAQTQMVLRRPDGSA